MGESIIFALEVWFLAFVVATLMAGVIKILLIALKKFSKDEQAVPAAKEGGDAT